MQEIERGFEMLNLEDEEHGGLVYEERVEELSEIDLRWCLLGRFLTDYPIDFQAMQHKLASLWRPGRGMYVKQIDTNRYLFQFYHELDIKRVVEGSPWTFGRFHLVFERLKEGDNPRTISINKMDIWVQLHNMSAGFMSQRVVQDIGNYIGEFVESDANNFVGVWREFLRVRVSISLDKPLKRRMKLKKNDQQWSWVNFRYESIPTFCFICGIVGHGEKLCERLFDTPGELLERPYGIWMRDPKRRPHTMGTKWLRPGGITPAKNTAVDDEERSDELVGVKSGKGDNASKKSGKAVENTIVFSTSNVGENQGVSIITEAEKQMPTVQVQGKPMQGAGEFFESDMSEIYVTEQKRRRKEIQSESEHEENIRTGGDEMEVQENDSMVQQNQKNELLAGAATQARHSS